MTPADRPRARRWSGTLGDVPDTLRRHQSRWATRLEQFGPDRVLLLLLCTWHLVVGVAFALVPPSLLSSRSLAVLFGFDNAAGVWGVAHGLVGVLALVRVLAEPSAARSRNALAHALWGTVMALTVTFSVGLTLPLLPPFGGEGNVLGIITWGLLLLPLWAYTAFLNTRREPAGDGSCG